jgi:DNA-binding NarL/FixJ family response regulator
VRLSPSGCAPIRVAVADDHALFRQGLRARLKLQPDVVVVGESERVDDIAPMIARSPCDVLVLDLRMDRSSLAVIDPLSKHAQIVVLTMSEGTEDALAVMRAGARALVFKRFAIETLLEAIRAVARGDVWLPPALQARLIASRHEQHGELLSGREREVVRYVALGLRNAEVAGKLFISEDTVKKHLNTIFHKLGIRDRVELALHAIQVGIITGDETRHDRQTRSTAAADHV